MGGILGKITGGLFGSPEAPEANIDEIMQILKIGDLYNNPNINTLFGGWRQEIGPDGRLTQSQYIDPKFQQGFDNFVSRFNEGSADPQLEQLRQARFEQMMGQSGPRPMPERRERPLNRSQYTDESGNSIAPPDWWRR